MKRLKIILQFKTIYIVIFLISLIYSLALTKIVHHKSIYSNNEQNFLCYVIDYRIDGNQLKVSLKCKEKIIGIYYIKSLEEKMYIEKNIKYGSTISAVGSLNKPNNNTVFNCFNYNTYLYNNKIYYILNINKLTINNSNIKIIYKIKNRFYERAKKINNDYIYALILGNKSFLDEETISSYKINGITHLLALSGLHVSVFSMFLFQILKKIKIKEIISLLLIFTIMILFYMISGCSISFLRALLLFLIVNISNIFRIKIHKDRVILILCSIFLFLNPFKIYDAGFLYSFIITFFIIKFLNNKQNSYIKNLIKVSLISYVSSFGLSIYYYGYTNLLSPLINLILVPFFSIIVFPLCIISFILPFTNNIFITIIYSFEYISKLFSTISLIINFPKINIVIVIIYYLLLYIFLKNHKWCVLIAIIFIIILMKYQYFFDNNSYFYFLDVGQGDSIVFVSPHVKKVLLIDTGGNIKYKTEKWKEKKTNYSIVVNKTIFFLKSIGINKVDYLIITHGDYDHMGEAINLVNNFKVDKVIFNCGPYNDLEKELIKVLNKKKIPYYSCIKELNIDKNKLYFLQTKEYDNENDNSNVTYTELGGYKFMFMGDASITNEKEILDKYNLQDIDVLKVGHHGSRTSSSKVFIDRINPKYSIISVGKNNRYGHPNKEVLENLEDSKIYRTDEDGSIMFKIKNNKLKIETCSP